MERCKKWARLRANHILRKGENHWGRKRGEGQKNPSHILKELLKMVYPAWSLECPFLIYFFGSKKNLV